MQPKSKRWHIAFVKKHLFQLAKRSENFSQSTVLILSVFVQQCWTICQLRNMLFSNEISQVWVKFGFTGECYAATNPPCANFAAMINSWINHTLISEALRYTFGVPGRHKIVLALNVRGPSYLGLTRLISWLLMPWLLTSPGHQQPLY